MRLSLRSDVLVVRHRAGVTLRASDTTLRFSVADSATSTSQEWLDLADLAGADWRELRTHLQALNWLAPTSRALPAGTASLVTVVRNLARDANMSPSGVVLTADEALAIPSSPDSGSGRVALRFFLSRLDWFRLKCYGSMLHLPPSELQLWGDVPAAPLVDDLRAVVEKCIGELPRSFQLRDGQWLPTSSARPGSLPSPDIKGEECGDRLTAVALNPSNILPVLAQPQVWMATGEFALPNLSFTTHPSAPGGVPRWCVGTSPDRDTARLKAVGEGVERFCLGDFTVADLLTAPAESLEGKWLCPTTVVAYSSSQKARLGLTDFDEGAPEWWVRGEGPVGPTWLPAALVYCPFSGREPWLAPGYPSSNGAAAHSSLAEARTKAFLELVERDAFMCTYLSGREPPALTERSFSAETASIHAMIVAETDRCGGFLMTGSLGIGAVGYAAWRDGRLCLGASAETDGDSAARKAMTEVLVQLRHPFETPLTDPTQVRAPEDHGRLYASDAFSSSASWLIEGAPADTSPSLDARRLTSARNGSYFHERLVDSWYVVRCIDPRQIQLTFGYDNEPLGHPALVRALAGNVTLTDPLIPHPFA